MTVVCDFDLISRGADNTFDENPFLVSECDHIAGTELCIRNRQNQIFLFEGWGHGVPVDDIARQQAEESDGCD